MQRKPEFVDGNETVSVLQRYEANFLFVLNSCTDYFLVFEEDASSWEDKLNRIHVLFGKRQGADM